MADKTQIVYEIRIEGADQQLAELDKLEKQLETLNEERQKLLKTQKDNGKLTNEESKKLEENRIAIRKNSQERRAQNKAIEDTIKYNRSASKSYDQLVADNVRLSAAMRKMEDPMGKNKKAIAAISKEIDKNTNELKEMDAAMGRHQRNVGNYSGAIRDAFGQMGFFSRELAIAASAMNLLKTATQNSAKGATTFKSAMQVIKIALASTGIGLVVVALGSLYKYFTSSSEAALKFKNAIAPVAALLGNVMELFQSVGKTIFDAFSNMSNFWSTLVSGFKQTREQMKSILADTMLEADLIRKMNNQKHLNAQLEAKDIEELARLEAAIAEARDKARNKEDYSAKQRKAAMLEAMELNKKIRQIEADAAARTLAVLNLEKVQQVRDAQETLELDKQIAEAKAAFFTADRNFFQEQKAMRREMLKLDKELAAQKAEETEATMRTASFEAEAINTITTAFEDAMNKHREAYQQAQQQQMTGADDLVMTLRNTEYTITDIALTESQKRTAIRKAEFDNNMMLASESMAMASSLFKENTAAYKVTASAEALMSTYLSANKALAQLPIPFSFIMAALLTAKGLQNVAQINNVKFAGGGVVPTGHELPGSSRHEDNTLALVKPGEVILNDRQQSALGGPSTFSRIGVPGFANGGIVPSMKAPTPSPSSMDMSGLASAMRDQRVFVLESDITKTQKNVRVIESLSSF